MDYLKTQFRRLTPKKGKKENLKFDFLTPMTEKEKKAEKKWLKEGWMELGGKRKTRRKKRKTRRKSKKRRKTRRKSRKRRNTRKKSRKRRNTRRKSRRKSRKKRR